MKSDKIYIVFDMDETIGQFGQLYFFIRAISKYNKKTFMMSEMLYLISKYTKYFRPYMFNIFNILKKDKIKYSKKLQVIIYSNNKIGKQWIDLMCKYIEYKLKFKLFDDVIGPYNVNNKIEDERRSTNSKTFSDFSNITSSTKDTPIMFMDNNFFKEMNKENIFYLLVEPYEYQYTIDDIIDIYLKEYKVDNIVEFKSFIYEVMHKTVYKNIKMEVTKKDIKNGHEIMLHLKNFLRNHLYNAHKRKKKHKTLKKIRRNILSLQGGRSLKKNRY